MENFFEINSLDDLPLAAGRLAEQIDASGRTVIAIRAGMGAGKTTLIGEFCRSVLGVMEPTTSPTFAIVNTYTTAKNQEVHHFDCYRFESEAEAHQIGIFEYLDSGNLCFIEWPERIEGILEECDVLWLTIDTPNPTKRVLRVL